MVLNSKRKTNKKNKTSNKKNKTNKKAGKMNAYFTAKEKARTAKGGPAKSFTYNGKTYKSMKTKTGMLVYKKA